MGTNNYTEVAMGNNGKQTFYCPYCGETLSFLDGTVVKLDGELQTNSFSVRTQFILPAKLGHYGAIVAGNVRLQEGAKVEFYCINSSCNANFTAVYDDDLAEIRMVDSECREYVVVFNKILGYRSTFLVDLKESKVLSSFGEHADDYLSTFERPLNFFGAV